jgi:hypothetical protein
VERAPAEVKITIEMAMDDITLIKPGCIYIIDHGHGKGHAGLGSALTSDGLSAISGNTNPRRSRDGDGVYADCRRLGELHGLLDYSRLKS